MEIQWPLVLFSLIAGTGGSLFAFVALSELLGGKEKTRFAATVTSLVLIVAGGCLSMLHLASPQNAFAALTNIFSFSGISIELMLLGLTFVVALAYAIVVKRLRNALAAKALAVVGGILGLALGYFCGHGYVIEAPADMDARVSASGLFRHGPGLRRIRLRCHSGPLRHRCRRAFRPHARRPRSVRGHRHGDADLLRWLPWISRGGQRSAALGWNRGVRHVGNGRTGVGAPARPTGSGSSRRCRRIALCCCGRRIGSHAHVGVRHGLLEPVRPYRSQRHAESLALWRAAMLDGRPPLKGARREDRRRHRAVRLSRRYVPAGRPVVLRTPE